MAELLWFSAAFLIVFTGIVIGHRLVKKNKKPTTDTVVEFTDNELKLRWKNHNITFTFITIEGQKYYSGAVCDEEYSCSIRSTTDKEYPWIIWAECGEDSIEIKTDLISKYEII